MTHTVRMPAANVAGSYAHEAARRAALAAKEALHPNCPHANWTPWEMGMYQNDVRTCRDCGRQEFD